jgi:hypothetical protein
MAKVSEFIANSEKAQTPIAKIDEDILTNEKTAETKDIENNVITFPETNSSDVPATVYTEAS